jgi:hypothetical protein
MHYLDAARIFPRERISHIARPIWRAIVDHQHAKARKCEDAAREEGKVLSLVISWNDD